MLTEHEPFATLLKRQAHLPVLLLDVQAEGRYGGARSVEREAQRRITALYGLPELAVDLVGEPGVPA